MSGLLRVGVFALALAAIFAVAFAVGSAFDFEGRNADGHAMTGGGSARAVASALAVPR